MSLALSGDTVAYLMGLGLDAEQMKGLIDRLQRDALAMAPPTAINGVNEERERLRNQSTYAERKRAKDRERQRQIREAARQSRDIDGDPAINRAMSPATEGTHSATPGDASRTCTGAQVVTPSLPSLRSEELGGGGGVGRERVPTSDPNDWPDGKASDHAEILVRLVESPWLDPSKSTTLITTLGRLAAWRRDGASWEHDVVPAVTALCANRRSAVSTWKFFDAAIARSIAENRAALKIPEAGRIVPFRATGPPRTIDEKSSASWDYAMARIAEDEQSAN